MYLYNIGYGHQDGSQFWQYFHEDQFSQECLEELIEDCLFEALMELIEPDSEFNSQKRPDFESLMSDPLWVNEGEPPRKPFHDALKRRGFNPARFEARCILYGPASSIDPGDGKQFTDDIDLRLQKKLRKRLEETGWKGDDDDEQILPPSGN